MQGLRLKFNDDKVVIDYTTPLETVVDCLSQNAVVNTATTSNSDKIYNKKGTDFFKKAVSGSIFNTSSASHASNFAAYESKIFINSTLPASQHELLESFVLSLVDIDSTGTMTVKAKSKSSEGTESTITWAIQ